MTAQQLAARAGGVRRLAVSLPTECWIVLALALMPFLLLAGGGSVDTAIRILLWGIFGLGFDILFGYAGMLSFGQAAFFGTGSFVTAYLLVSGLVTNFLLAIGAGVVASMLFSVLVGMVALKRVGIYFSMITFAIGELCFFIQHSVLSRWTGGDNGLPGVPHPVFQFGDRSFELASGWGMYAVIATIFVATFWFARRVVTSPFGRVLNATRINPERTLAVGHDVQRYKMAAFVVAAGYAGLAGTLMGIFQSYVGPDAFALDTSGQVVMQTVVGGVRTLIGPLVGAAVWIYLRDILQQIPGIGGMWKLILGALFILAVTTMRRGIVGEIQHVFYKRRMAAAAAAAAATEKLAAFAPAAPPADFFAAAAGTATASPRAAASDDGVPAIEARHIRKQFGGLVALEDVCLSVREGEIMGLIGPNGAGKSTLFRILTGEMPATSGEVHFRGKNITGVGVREACAMGISKSYQIVQVYPELSLRENLLVPLLARQRGAFRFDVMASVKRDGELMKDADRLLAMMGLSDRLGGPVSDLSYGEKRRLEIGIALATQPDVLLLDEPLAGLSPEERVQVVGVIKAASIGRTTLVVEHDMDALFGLADRIAVLHMGRNLAVGPPAEIRENPIVHTAYMGGRDED
ncbi:branched-chain amino acid ABC transporter ATP-binding protein/permease [Methylibium petroleiphilum]|uniref:branched-chain amino acid ABC transporter ATP-binding protein/permease n=1 Tax=Methylibium petroleiphilum TaxID=105560 RepID=UPI001AC16670|nr:branched-chain amino acid ABC transporter ATP-binding protein/permease [Methylibium petroleiphilum]MBN9205789.1 branched-chain amino acid ABC transporter ATP-binding protein/permease [Methylibium petroleiphilum]